MKHLLYLGVVALTAFTLVPDVALAQDDTGLRTGAQLVIDVDRANVLQNDARQIERTADQAQLAGKPWVEAAKLYVESAEHRPYGDPDAYVALNRAGNLFFNAGRSGAAHKAFGAAGIRALETGHVYEAGLAFADAAQSSQQRTRDSRMGFYYYKVAYRLSESPMLSVVQRKALHTRLGLNVGVALQ